MDYIIGAAIALVSAVVGALLHMRYLERKFLQPPKKPAQPPTTGVQP